MELFILLLIGLVTYLFIKQKKTKTAQGNLKAIEAAIVLTNNTLQKRETELSELNSTIQSQKDSIQRYEADERVAAERAKFASDLAAKEFKIEAASRRDEFERQLESQLQELEKSSPKAALQSELKAINAEIEQARQTILIQQKQQQELQAKEDFDNFHSITLTAADINDIKFIRQIEPQLTRQEAFRKLIWTEFIQKQVQLLCKTLNAEKVRGIYKITNVVSSKMYIGQAVDIADRWKTHCKTALGIGSNSFMTNKFYKAMHDEGIENFTFEVLEAGDIDLNERERYWIEFYNAIAFGYNSKAGG